MGCGGQDPHAGRDLADASLGFGLAKDVPGITASLYLDSVEYWAPCQALEGTGAWEREPATRKRAPDNTQVSAPEA